MGLRLQAHWSHPGLRKGDVVEAKRLILFLFRWEFGTWIPPRSGRTPKPGWVAAHLGQLESKFSYKAHMAMDGAPNFASRRLLHFRSFAGEICTTAAGRANSFIVQLREFSPIRRQSPKRRAATVCIFCNRVLHVPDDLIRASSKIPQTALFACPPFLLGVHCITTAKRSNRKQETEQKPH